MDKIDTLLIQAWNRISRKARADRIEALKRSQRRFGKRFTQPVREWCLVLRASDRRIDETTAEIDPYDADTQRLAHTVRITGTLMRELTKPVMIDWPGVTIAEAAKMLGRGAHSLHTWINNGVFQVDRYPEFRFPRHYRRPYLWTPSPIDPNNFHGRTPHQVWGTLWQWLWQKIPHNALLEVQRVPKFQHTANCRKFTQWFWICPGRVNEDNEYTGCGRRCTYLYLPRTVWTLPKAMGDDIGFEMPEESGLVGRWYPGWSDPVAEVGSFACKECWKVRSPHFANAKGWNDFVTKVSGGLLYGSEVPRPLDICPLVRRKRRYKKRRNDQPSVESQPQWPVIDGASAKSS